LSHLTGQPQQKNSGGTAKFVTTAREHSVTERVKKFRKTILVSGTPGVGKTAVSQKLASRLDAQYIGVTEFVKSENLITSVDEERKTLIADTEKVSKQLQKILDKSEGNIIIEGHYVVDVVPKKEVNIVFVLRRDPHELKKVLEKRGYTEKKIWENLAAEILDVCLWDAISACGADKVCEIDVSGKTVEAVVEEMLQVLEKKKECSSGIVDWLRKLENEGQLEEFLRKI
jgi:adenylate kinase